MQVPGIVLVKNDVISSSLKTLLSKCDAQLHVYNYGKGLFYNIIQSNELDFMSSSPLKAAYV